MCVAWAQEGLVPRDTGFSEHPFQLRGGPPWELADFYHDCHLPPPVRVGWDPPHPLCSMSSHLPPQASSLHLRLCPRFQAGPEKEPGLKRGQNHLRALLSDPTFWGHLGCQEGWLWGIPAWRGNEEMGPGEEKEGQRGKGEGQRAGGRAGAPRPAPRGWRQSRSTPTCTQGLSRCYPGHSMYWVLAVPPWQARDTAALRFLWGVLSLSTGTEVGGRQVALGEGFRGEA